MLPLDGSYDSNGNGRYRTHKDDAVDDLVVDLLAALEGLVDQHGLSIHEDKASQHEYCMQIELLPSMIRPCKSFFMLNNPIDKEDD